jgi:uncharacterized membrane-anchored protein
MERINKVARITLFFWVIKILATTLGETFGDMLSMTLKLGYLESLIIMSIFFLIVLLIQLNVSRFYSGLYWLVIVGTTTVGTEISDFMDRTLGLGYALGSFILFSFLMLILYVWHRQEKGIRYYPITSIKVETLFWIAVLFSNSLGTAFGDFLSDNVGLSYIHGAFVTAIIIGVVLVLHYFTKLNEVLLFWIAFIFTRPFGATFGDLLTKPLSKGGLDLGTIPSTIITAILVILLVVFVYFKEKRVIQNFKI